MKCVSGSWKVLSDWCMFPFEVEVNVFFKGLVTKHVHTVCMYSQYYSTIFLKHNRPEAIFQKDYWNRFWIDTGCENILRWICLEFRKYN